ncbi:MAG: 4-hydroxy-tetrahydrodipicolinate synthase, partial [Vicinamibacteria bacterium]
IRSTSSATTFACGRSDPMIALASDDLTGSYPPLVTPFRAGRVDLDAYAKLIEFQIANGTHGLVVNGPTSEPTTLDAAERNLLVDTAVKVAAGRIPVVAQTGSQSHAETCALTDHAQKAGADAIMVLTPYFVRAPQRGVVAYFEDVARHTDKPLLMYHIPGRSAFKVELDTLVRIAEAVPHFVGIKHALDDHGFVTQMIAKLGPAFRIFVGLEEFTFPMMAIGAQGTMNAVANVAPRQVADLCNAVRAGDLARARKLHFDLYELMCAVFWDTNPIAM